MSEQTPEGQQPQGAEQGQQQQQASPWGEDFDAEKAWKLVQNLRDENKGLKARPILDDTAKAKLAEYDQLKAASQTDLEKAQGELARWQSEAEKWRTTSVSSTIKALAAADFEFPEDAVGALDAAKYLDAGGVIDEKAIQADLKELLDARPNWRRSNGETQTPRAPRPNAAQGASSAPGSGASDPAQQFAAALQSALR